MATDLPGSSLQYAGCSLQAAAAAPDPGWVKAYPTHIRIFTTLR